MLLNIFIEHFKVKKIKILIENFNFADFQFKLLLLFCFSTNFQLSNSKK